MGAKWHRREDRLELTLSTNSEEGLFEAMAAAFPELVHRLGDGLPDRLPVLIRAYPPASLLREFVEDLLYLVEVEHFTTSQLERLRLDGTRLRAAVSGSTGPAELRAAHVRSLEIRYDPGSNRWRATLNFASLTRRASR